VKLTALANGRSCTVRGPNCNGDHRTTVSAHFRSQRLGAGMAQKPDDLFCAFACSTCHDWVDGRLHIKGFTREEARHYHALGVLETQKWLLDAGYVHTGKRL
jgi:Putative nuclease YbcO